MYEVSGSPLAAALGILQADIAAPLDDDTRRGQEQMQWLIAQGAAARILGALADGVTPAAASSADGVTMAPSPLANMCEFVALTSAGLDPETGRSHVGPLRAEDAGQAMELCARERHRIRGLARLLYQGHQLDAVWFRKLAAYQPDELRNELYAAVAKWTGMSFERIHSARKLLSTMPVGAPLREAGQVAGYLLAGEVPELATLEPRGVLLERGGHVRPASNSQASKPPSEDLEKFSLTRLGGMMAERLVGEVPRDLALVRAAGSIGLFDTLRFEMFGTMQPQQVFEMYERYVAESFRPHVEAIRAVAAELEKHVRLYSDDLLRLGSSLGLLQMPDAEVCEGELALQ